jgi:uncharacterized protein (TIGR02421 family)
VSVYRRPIHADDPGTADLVTTEALYVAASSRRSQQAGLRLLLHQLGEVLREQFGAVLFLELWAGPPVASVQADGRQPTPSFRVLAPRHETLDRFTDTLVEALSRITIDRQGAVVDVVRTNRCFPARMRGLLPDEPGWHVLGLEVSPIYRASDSSELFPLVLRSLRRQLSRALQRSFFQFTRSHTTHRPPHYQALGRRAIRKVVLEIDHKLAAVANSFDFLLQVTPVNPEPAWRAFRSSHYRKPPVFRYRPLPVDPLRLKRALFKIPAERIEDPAIAHILHEKQDELDRKITMLRDMNTPRFVHGSVQLYGGVEPPLLDLVHDLLRKLPKGSRQERQDPMDAAAFADRARDELRLYRSQWTELDASVEVRDDLAVQFLVSQGTLLIGRNARVPASRVDALLQHEIGTHVLTYYNGRAQPLQQLHTGLAGYEALQEGIAVLAEHLVGGLTPARLRLLAARVVAVHHLLNGRTFVDTFADLHETYGFDLRKAFSITLRVYRGGGLTKDVVYLRGLCRLLDYLKDGGDLQPLFIGKIALEHAPIILELRRRGVLSEPPLRPRYMELPDARERLAALKNGTTVLDLIRRNR